MKTVFSDCHPAVNFLYFALVLLFSMFLLHPAALCVSLAVSFIWSARLGGGKALRFQLLALLPMMAFTALLNPLFNHEGATILFYLPTGNPLTLESVFYGLAAGAMLGTVFLWFSCYNRVMTTDKFLYLFGRAAPALSLLISMVLRFVPKFRAQLKAVSDAQRCVGRGGPGGGVVRRAGHGLRVLSVMVTWSLENAVDTADSMKSRGYGLPGRTAFSIYRFSARDRGTLCLLCVLGGFVACAWAMGGFYVRYFPTVKTAPPGFWQLSGLAAYLLLCMTPLILDWREERAWKRTASST